MKFKRILTALLAMIMLLSTFTFVTSAAPSTSKLLGDVDGDGKITKKDYMLLKSYLVTKKAKLDEEALLRADINKNGRNDKADYMLLKSYFFGRYVISGEITVKSATEKIAEAIGKGKKISRDFSGVIGSVSAEATVSFVVSSKGVLSLQGNAVADNGMVIEMTIPLSAVAAEYTFSGDAEMDAISGTCKGTIVAKTYSIDKMEFEKIEFTTSVELPDDFMFMMERNCKDAMDQFLYHAHLLLNETKTGVTIGDLGFTTYLDEINDGWVEF